MDARWSGRLQRCLLSWLSSPYTPYRSRRRTAVPVAAGGLPLHSPESTVSPPRRGVPEYGCHTCLRCRLPDYLAPSRLPTAGGRSWGRLMVLTPSANCGAMGAVSSLHSSLLATSRSSPLLSILIPRHSRFRPAAILVLFPHGEVTRRRRPALENVDGPTGAVGPHPLLADQSLGAEPKRFCHDGDPGGGAGVGTASFLPCRRQRRYHPRRYHPRRYHPPLYSHRLTVAAAIGAL